MVSLAFEIKESEAFKDFFKKVPDITAKYLTLAVYEASLILQREIAERTPTGASGGSGLRASIIASKPIRTFNNVTGIVGTPLKYAAPVELGTKPHRPPIGPLIEYAYRKLGVPIQDAKRVAFMIAAKINKRGTKGSFMFKEGLKASEIQMDKIFKNALKRIKKELKA